MKETQKCPQLAVQLFNSSRVCSDSLFLNKEITNSAVPLRRRLLHTYYYDSQDNGLLKLLS